MASEAKRKIFQSKILSNEKNKEIINEILKGISKKVDNLDGVFTYYGEVPNAVIEYFEAEGYEMEFVDTSKEIRFKWL